MNCIRKTAAGTAAILLSLTMSACHQTAPSSVTTVATMPESSKSTLAAVQVQGGEELDKLLDQVEDNVFPGTAGCSLKATQAAADLVACAKELKETDLQAVAVAAKEWYDALPGDRQQVFQENWPAIETDARSLARDPASMLDALDEADRDPSVRAVVVTGEGDHFCSGADLSTVEDDEFVARLGRVLRLADDVVLLPVATRYEQEGGGTETTTERRIVFSPEIPRRVAEARSEWRLFAVE